MNSDILFNNIDVRRTFYFQIRKDWQLVMQRKHLKKWKYVWSN